MCRLTLACLTALLVTASPAQAVLVYQRPSSGRLVAARDNGNHAHVIARPRGRVVASAVSPNGRWVVYVVQDSALNADSDSGPAYIVSTTGGRVRLLAANDVQVLTSYPSSIAWSPDSRYVALGAAIDRRVVVIDVRSGKRRSIPLTDNLFDGASFSPSSTQLVVASGGSSPDSSAELDVVRLRTLEQNGLGSGGLPEWGRRGLAYQNDEGLELIARPGGTPRTLAPASEGFIYPIAWSRDGKRLLALKAGGSGAGLAEDRALLLAPATRSQAMLPQVFAEIDALSHDGRDVLGIVDHDVVDAHADGTTHVFARDARSPSWNR
jgi:WD40 repeat protein